MHIVNQYRHAVNSSAQQDEFSNPFEHGPFSFIERRAWSW